MPAASSQIDAAGPQPGLDSILTRWDLVFLFVVAVANLNVVPAIAGAGAITVWLWLLAFAFYFWPQGVAVIELANRWPGEGGVYLWTKASFGEGHGFLAGWCYWLANVVYLPTVLLSAVGVGVYIFGPAVQQLTKSQPFTASASIALLALLLVLNLRGRSSGKWIANLGGIGTVVGSVIVVSLAAILLRRHGSMLAAHDLRPHLTDWRLLAVFGTICYSLQGLDLASLMGDEIREPRKVLPGAVLLGGLIAGAVYLSVTSAMLVGMPAREIGVLSGVLQAISVMAGKIQLQWMVAPLALFELLALVGTASAWFNGTARLPFVAGIDAYLPPALGRVHPRYHTPHVALITFAALSALLILASYLGVTVSEAYLTLLSIAVFLQMIPSLYMFGALLLQALRHGAGPRRLYVVANAVAGLLSSGLAACLVFVPPEAQPRLWVYESKLVVALAVVFGAALFFYLRRTSNAPSPMLS